MSNAFRTSTDQCTYSLGDWFFICEKDTVAYSCYDLDIGPCNRFYAVFQMRHIMGVCIRYIYVGLLPFFYFSVPSILGHYSCLLLSAISLFNHHVFLLCPCGVINVWDHSYFFYLSTIVSSGKQSLMKIWDTIVWYFWHAVLFFLRQHLVITVSRVWSLFSQMFAWLPPVVLFATTGGRYVLHAENNVTISTVGNVRLKNRVHWLWKKVLH